MKIRIYRDPTSEATGGAPVATPEAPAAPQIVTPRSYGGSSTFKDWQDPYDDPKLQAQTQPQPPASSGNQGGQPVQPQPAGLPPAPDTSTTAPAAPGQAAGEQGASWSPEGRKYLDSLQAKDPAFKDMPFHPAVEKLALNTRELEQKYTQGQQYLGVVNQTIEDYKAVLASGDPAEIAKMVEHFGGEVKFDTRAPADVINELNAGYTSVVQALQAVQAELPQEAIPVINRALAHLHAQTQGKVAELQQKESIKAQVQAMAKASGITPQIGNPNERYKASAQANMTALEREMNDPNFWSYYDEIKAGFAPGGIFHAQGLTAGKAFGASIDSARHYMDLAKGRWLAKNMDTKVLPAYEQTWLKKHQGNGAVAPPPKGAGAVTAPQNQDPSETAYARKLEEHMNRRNGIR
jgi:hypothetical protein